MMGYPNGNGHNEDARLDRIDEDQRDLQVEVAKLIVSAEALSDKFDVMSDGLNDKMDELKDTMEKHVVASGAAFSKLEDKLVPLEKRVDAVEGQLGLAKKVLEVGVKRVLPVLLALLVGLGGPSVIEALKLLLGSG